MSKRTAARELALIGFSHLSKNLKKADDVNIAEIIHKSADTLCSEAEDLLNSSVKEMMKIREFVQNHEIEAPENLERPYQVGTLPVGIPLTSDMLGRIDTLVEAVNDTYSAVELTKLASFEGLDQVKDFAVKIVKAFLDNKDEVDAKIKEHSKEWDVQRLIKIDRDILRIAVVEILFFDDVPKGVSIDEAVELAKKYSSEESSRFINGILGQVVNV